MHREASYSEKQMDLVLDELVKTNIELFVYKEMIKRVFETLGDDNEHT